MNNEQNIVLNNESNRMLDNSDDQNWKDRTLDRTDYFLGENILKKTLFAWLQKLRITSRWIFLRIIDSTRSDLGEKSSETEA